jgi:hypothetical protein
MNIKLKKIIAREFLVLLGSILLIFLMLFARLGYRNYLDNKETSIKEEISSKTENLNTFLKNGGKHPSITQQTLDNFIKIVTENELTDGEIYKLFPVFNDSRDTLQAAFEYLNTYKSGKYKTIDEVNSKFPEFFLDKKEEYKEYRLFEKDIKQLKMKLEDVQFSVKYFPSNETLLQELTLVVFFIMYVLRYLYYAVRWSLKVLKE